MEVREYYLEKFDAFLNSSGMSDMDPSILKKLYKKLEDLGESEDFKTLSVGNYSFESMPTTTVKEIRKKWRLNKNKLADKLKIIADEKKDKEISEKNRLAELETKYESD